MRLFDRVPEHQNNAVLNPSLFSAVQIQALSQHFLVLSLCLGVLPSPTVPMLENSPYCARSARALSEDGYSYSAHYVLCSVNN